MAQESPVVSCRWMNELVYCINTQVHFWNYIPSVNCLRPYKQNLRLLEQWELVSSIFMLTLILGRVSHALQLISVLKPNLRQSIRALCSSVPFHSSPDSFYSLHLPSVWHPGIFTGLRGELMQAKNFVSFWDLAVFIIIINCSMYPDNKLNVVYLMFPPYLVIT